MTREERIGLAAAAIGSMLIAVPALAANTEQAPYDKCVAVPKIQYDSAKKQNLLEDRFGIYVRTGRFLRRRYWYCH